MRKRKKIDNQTADEWLRDYLCHGERAATEVFEDSPFPIRTIKRAKQRIGAGSGKKDGIWHWYLVISESNRMPANAAKPQPTVDEYGYSTVVPKVTATVNWGDVLRAIVRLRKSGMDHAAIINQIMGMAYPHAGIPEHIIMVALRNNGVNVPNKVLDTKLEL